MTNHWQKLIRSLQQKKYREQERLFLIEGRKNLLEALQSGFPMAQLFLTEAFAQEVAEWLPNLGCPVETTKEADLVKVGTLQTNPFGLAVAHIPGEELPKLTGTTLLALDGIRDPGNLGTIWRVADWYGISLIVCSPDCVDAYNPKVIAASMGAFCRVSIVERELEAFLPALKASHHIYAATVQGDNLHQATLQQPAVFIMGNEANGIRPAILPYAHQFVSIPAFGGAESLNAAIATAICCDHFRRSFPV